MYNQENTGAILVLPYTESRRVIFRWIISLFNYYRTGLDILYTVWIFRLIFDVYKKENIALSSIKPYNRIKKYLFLGGL